MKKIKVAIVDQYHADVTVALVDQYHADFLIDVCDEYHADMKVAVVDEYHADYKVAISGDYDQTKTNFQSLLSLARNGNVDAQFEVGLCYDEGNGVSVNKYEAFKWFKEAALRGHARAQNAVGICYEYGEGVGINKNEAIRWYEMSIKNGCTKGMMSLAGIYLNDGNEDGAWVLIKCAAQMGNKDAQDIMRRFGRTY